MVGESKLSKRTFIWAFLFPCLLGLAAFKLIPMLVSLAVSFTNWDTMSPLSSLTAQNFIGLKNFYRVFTDENSVNALLNTFKFIIGYLPLLMCLSIFFAVQLNKQIKGIRIYRSLFFVPVITSWVAVSIVWRWLLNGQSGIINYLLSLAGIQGPIWLSDFFWAMPAIIMVTVWKDLGFFTIILLSGLQNISDEYYEAAEIDGAGPWKRLTKVTLPLLTPTLFFVLVISLINAFQLFDQVLILTNGGPAGATSTMVEQIYKNAFKGNNMGFASAQSWILFIIILIVTLFQNKIQGRWVTYDSK
jgi:multiple sugar transport system permease protein